MAQRYHISPVDYTPKPCSATVKDCLYAHYTDMNKALEAAEQMLESRYGESSLSSKTNGAKLRDTMENSSVNVDAYKEFSEDRTKREWFKGREQQLQHQENLDSSDVSKRRKAAEHAQIGQQEAVTRINNEKDKLVVASYVANPNLDTVSTELAEKRLREEFGDESLYRMSYTDRMLSQEARERYTVPVQDVLAGDRTMQLIESPHAADRVSAAKFGRSLGDYTSSQIRKESNTAVLLGYATNPQIKIADRVAATSKVRTQLTLEGVAPQKIDRIIKGSQEEFARRRDERDELTEKAVSEKSPQKLQEIIAGTGDRKVLTAVLINPLADSVSRKQAHNKIIQCAEKDDNFTGMKHRREEYRAVTEAQQQITEAIRTRRRTLDSYRLAAWRTN